MLSYGQTKRRVRSQVRPHDPIPLREIEAARGPDRRSGRPHHPLVRLNADDLPAEVYLKLENLQPVGSFKIRGAYNAMAQLAAEDLADGVWTVSAGNMAQGLAWCARERGVPCTVVVPEQAPETKLANVTRLGAKYVKVPFHEFEETFITRRREGIPGCLVHPFSNRAVMAGNGTIGLEILEDLPDVDAVVIAYAGGGLSCGRGLGDSGSRGKRHKALCRRGRERRTVCGLHGRGQTGRRRAHANLRRRYQRDHGLRGDVASGQQTDGRGAWCRRWRRSRRRSS